MSYTKPQRELLLGAIEVGHEAAVLLSDTNIRDIVTEFTQESARSRLSEIAVIEGFLGVCKAYLTMMAAPRDETAS